MIETTDCIARVNGDVKARSNEGEKRTNVQRLFRRGFTVDECARLTYDGTIPKVDGERQDVRFGDATSHAKELDRWASYLRRVQGWCNRQDGE